MERNSVMETIIRRAALIGAAAVLLFSIYFSYDGFDQTVTGKNEGYDGIGIVLGFGLAIVFTIVQFIFNSGFGKLNLTLIVAGGLAYVYSIRMNYLGVVDILGITDMYTAATIAAAMDILPESMIAWALGDSLKGDLFGNAIKSVGYVLGSIFGVVEKKVQNQKPETQKTYAPATKNYQSFQPVSQSKKGKGRQHWQNQSKQGDGFGALLKEIKQQNNTETNRPVYTGELSYHPKNNKPNRFGE